MGFLIVLLILLLSFYLFIIYINIYLIYILFIYILFIFIMYGKILPKIFVVTIAALKMVQLVLRLFVVCF